MRPISAALTQLVLCLAAVNAETVTVDCARVQQVDPNGQIRDSLLHMYRFCPEDEDATSVTCEYLKTIDPNGLYRAYWEEVFSTCGWPHSFAAPSATSKPETLKRDAEAGHQMLLSFGLPGLDFWPPGPLETKPATHIATQVSKHVSSSMQAISGRGENGYTTLSVTAYRWPSSKPSSTKTVLVTKTVDATPTSIYNGRYVPASCTGIDNSDKTGPGIYNLPMKKIKGYGGDKGNTKMTFPNKHGSPQCKEAKHCVALNRESVQPCIEQVQMKIRELACSEPNRTFAPLEPIVCGPSGDSTYCAVVQYIPFVTKNAKANQMFQRMYTEPYLNMTVNQVPIGAIKEGVDWIVENGAKLCGQALLPVPQFSTKAGGKPGHVYAVVLDVDSRFSHRKAE